MRITLTKSEAATAAGVELLSLCTTITEDGRITEQEVEALRHWLQDNADSNLPAIAFLKATVDRIIADGRIWPAEKAELHSALERVLPKELRQTAQTQRRKREIEDQIEARRNAPVAYFDFMVAGTSYEGRDRLIRAYAGELQKVFLIRDPGNQFSRNAVKVFLANGASVGFVPEEDAIELAPLLDSGHKQIAWVKKILQAARGPIPVVVAEVYLPDTLNQSAVFATMQSLPTPPSPSAAAGRQPAGTQSRPWGCCLGCGGSVAVIMAVLIVVLAVLFWGL